MLVPTTACTNPYELILDPSTRIIATLRAGRMIAGSLEGMVQADRP